MCVFLFNFQKWLKPPQDWGRVEFFGVKKLFRIVRNCAVFVRGKKGPKTGPEGINQMLFMRSLSVSTMKELTETSFSAAAWFNRSPNDSG